MKQWHMSSETNQLTSYDIADGWQAVSVALVVARGVVVLAGARHWISEWGGFTREQRVFDCG